MGSILNIYILASGAIAIPMVKQLYSSSKINIISLVTQPARPMGRDKIITPTPIGKLAREKGFSLMEIENINGKEFQQHVYHTKPDMLVVFSFGQILKRNLLDAIPLGSINIHASLLPLYRGASPINACLLDDQKETGISVMKINEKLDEGAIFMHKNIPIEEEETYLSLHNKIAELTGKNITKILMDIANGKLLPSKQNEKLATFSSKITKKDGLINWKNSAEMINRQRRAYFPWPGIYFILNGKRLQITNCTPINSDDKQPIGKISFHNGEFMVKCGEDSWLKILEILPEGKKKMSTAEFLRGNLQVITETV